MRPLPDLTPLPESPDVYDQNTDSFSSAFASDFNAIDSLLGQASSDESTVNQGISNIGDSIDSLSTSLDTATQVLDGLSAELDLVDLLPTMSSFQSADNQLDSNLNNPLVDLGSIFNDFLSFIETAITDLVNLAIYGIKIIINGIEDVLDWVYQEVVWIMSAYGGLL